MKKIFISKRVVLFLAILSSGIESDIFLTDAKTAYASQKQENVIVNAFQEGFAYEKFEKMLNDYEEAKKKFPEPLDLNDKDEEIEQEDCGCLENK